MHGRPLDHAPGALPLTRPRLTRIAALAVFAVALAALAFAGPARAGTLPGAGIMPPPWPLRAKEFAFLKEGAYFHVFWMRIDPTVSPDSTERDIGHAVSRDLIHWTQLPVVLPWRPTKWDNFHIWSPSIIKSGTTYFMYYTGVTRVPYAWPSYQRIGVATSTDLLNWTRYDSPVLSGSMVPWVDADSSTFAGCQFRDAFPMLDPNVPGRILLYYVATPAAATSQLIAAVAQSTNFTTWSDLMPLWCTDAAHYWGWCESPHLIQHNGLWYLFATTNSGHPIGFRTAPSPTADSTLWSGKYRLYDMANQDPASDAFFGSEALSSDGHDYLGVVDGSSYVLAFYEIVWNATPPGFTLATPSITADAGPDAAPTAAPALVVDRSGGGPGVLLRATLPAAMDARVDLYDVAGRRVRALRSGAFPAGETVVAWDARLEGGAFAPAGLYFAALETPAGRRSARVCVAP